MAWTTSGGLETGVGMLRRRLALLVGALPPPQPQVRELLGRLGLGEPLLRAKLLRAVPAVVSRPWTLLPAPRRRLRLELDRDCDNEIIRA